jgi:hypothetical protein
MSLKIGDMNREGDRDENRIVLCIEGGNCTRVVRLLLSFGISRVVRYVVRGIPHIVDVPGRLVFPSHAEFLAKTGCPFSDMAMRGKKTFRVWKTPKYKEFESDSLACFASVSSGVIICEGVPISVPGNTLVVTCNTFKFCWVQDPDVRSGVKPRRYGLDILDEAGCFACLSEDDAVYSIVNCVSEYNSAAGFLVKASQLCKETPILGPSGFGIPVGVRVNTPGNLLGDLQLLLGSHTGKGALFCGTWSDTGECDYVQITFHLGPFEWMYNLEGKNLDYFCAQDKALRTLLSHALNVIAQNHLLTDEVRRQVDVELVPESMKSQKCQRPGDEDS